MGVSGSGKSTVGALVAAELGVPFADGDDLHPAANIAKMAAGQALDDADRAPWLAAVGRWLRDAHEAGTGGVTACSALRRTYRDRLRAACPQAYLVELDAPQEVIAARLAARRDHFMPPALLASQYAALEPLQPDECGVRLPAAAADAESLAAQAVRAWRRTLPPSAR
ncbi:gluconokinase [Yinghuangia soli]|uniref:Gluconokinase n=1 Tax=Yinghuangia soli TaxID=2908204 RepID=A0AA41U420_9ACTN|nr:gluconokinase [Yinghuangia soli]MCF2530342.1 gluconokinase [Yinghuangia soli]